MKSDKAACYGPAIRTCPHLRTSAQPPAKTAHAAISMANQRHGRSRSESRSVEPGLAVSRPSQAILLLVEAVMLRTGASQRIFLQRGVLRGHLMLAWPQMQGSELGMHDMLAHVMGRGLAAPCCLATTADGWCNPIATDRNERVRLGSWCKAEQTELRRMANIERVTADSPELYC